MRPVFYKKFCHVLVWILVAFCSNTLSLCGAETLSVWNEMCGCCSAGSSVGQDHALNKSINCGTHTQGCQCKFLPLSTEEGIILGSFLLTETPKLDFLSPSFYGCLVGYTQTQQKLKKNYLYSQQDLYLKYSVYLE